MFVLQTECRERAWVSESGTSAGKKRKRARAIRYQSERVAAKNRRVSRSRVVEESL